MKAVLISINPKWCELIASGEKTVEVRKTRPKINTPFKVYIYCTKDNAFAEKTLRGFDDDGKAIYYKANKGKVIGEFVCDWAESTPLWRIKGNTGFLAKRTEREALLPTRACLSLEELKKYIGSENKLIYGWHISDLVIYDEPRELSEFNTLKKCTACKGGYESTACIYDEGCRAPTPITRPPQSWCYVEDTE